MLIRRLKADRFECDCIIAAHARARFSALIKRRSSKKRAHNKKLDDDQRRNCRSIEKNNNTNCCKRVCGFVPHESYFDVSRATRYKRARIKQFKNKMQREILKIVAYHQSLCRRPSMGRTRFATCRSRIYSHSGLSSRRHKQARTPSLPSTAI